MDNSPNLPSTESLSSSYRTAAWLQTVALAFLALLVTAPAWATLGPDRVLSNSGDIIRVHSAPFGELFPGRTDANPAHRALALDFEYPDGIERHLVPLTGTWRPERHATVAYDSRNDAVMLFWVSGAADGTWSMDFTSFRDGEWQQTSNIKSNNSAVFIQGLPKVVVTTDDFFLDLGEEIEPLESRRTTFHVVWHEGDKTRYAPASFIDGVFVGWSEAFNLSDLVFQAHQGGSGTDEIPPGFLPSNLASSLSLAPATDPNAVAVTLTDSATGRLATLRIEETPMSLAHLANRVRDDVLTNVDSYAPDDLGILADFIRSDIIFIGNKTRLHPSVCRFIADEIAGWLIANGEAYGNDLSAMSQDAWRETLEAGASIHAKSLGNTHIADDPVLELVDPQVSPFFLGKLKEQIRVTMPSSFEAPAVGTGETFVYTSADHRLMLVAWKNAEAKTIQYVENLGFGWTQPLSLQLNESLTESMAQDLLQRKIR